MGFFRTKSIKHREEQLTEGTGGAKVAEKKKGPKRHFLGKHLGKGKKNNEEPIPQETEAVDKTNVAQLDSFASNGSIPVNVSASGPDHIELEISHEDIQEDSVVTERDPPPPLLPSPENTTATRSKRGGLFAQFRDMKRNDPSKRPAEGKKVEARISEHSASNQPASPVTKSIPTTLRPPTPHADANSHSKQGTSSDLSSTGGKSSDPPLDKSINGESDQAPTTKKEIASLLGSDTNLEEHENSFFEEVLPSFTSSSMGEEEGVVPFDPVKAVRGESRRETSSLREAAVATTAAAILAAKRRDQNDTEEQTSVISQETAKYLRKLELRSPDYFFEDDGYMERLENGSGLSSFEGEDKTNDTSGSWDDHYTTDEEEDDQSTLVTDGDRSMNTDHEHETVYHLTENLSKMAAMLGQLKMPHGWNDLQISMCAVPENESRDDSSSDKQGSCHEAENELTSTSHSTTPKAISTQSDEINSTVKSFGAARSDEEERYIAESKSTLVTSRTPAVCCDTTDSNNRLRSGEQDKGARKNLSTLGTAALGATIVSSLLCSRQDQDTTDDEANLQKESGLGDDKGVTMAMTEETISMQQEGSKEEIADDSKILPSRSIPQETTDLHQEAEERSLKIEGDKNTEKREDVENKETDAIPPIQKATSRIISSRVIGKDKQEIETLPKIERDGSTEMGDDGYKKEADPIPSIQKATSRIIASRVIGKASSKDLRAARASFDSLGDMDVRHEANSRSHKDGDVRSLRGVGSGMSHLESNFRHDDKHPSYGGVGSSYLSSDDDDDNCKKIRYPQRTITPLRSGRSSRDDDPLLEWWNGLDRSKPSPSRERHTNMRARSPGSAERTISRQGSPMPLSTTSPSRARATSPNSHFLLTDRTVLSESPQSESCRPGLNDALSTNQIYTYTDRASLGRRPSGREDSFSVFRTRENSSSGYRMNMTTSPPRAASEVPKPVAKTMSIPHEMLESQRFAASENPRSHPGAEFGNTKIRNSPALGPKEIVAVGSTDETISALSDVSSQIRPVQSGGMGTSPPPDSRLPMSDGLSSRAKAVPAAATSSCEPEFRSDRFLLDSRFYNEDPDMAFQRAEAPKQPSGPPAMKNTNNVPSPVRPPKPSYAATLRRVSEDPEDPDDLALLVKEQLRQKQESSVAAGWLYEDKGRRDEQEPAPSIPVAHGNRTLSNDWHKDTWQNDEWPEGSHVTLKNQFNSSNNALQRADDFSSSPSIFL